MLTNAMRLPGQVTPANQAVRAHHAATRTPPDQTTPIGLIQPNSVTHGLPVTTAVDVLATGRPL